MTKPLEVVEEALRLFDTGMPILQISKRVGASRAAILEWTRNRDRRVERARAAAEHASGERCPKIASLDRRAYAYLLGQYLGDGCLTPLGPRGVFKLRIATCDAYPNIRQRCIDAVLAVMPENKVGIVQAQGCSEVCGYSKHWPCLFPQHGPGRKHERKIELADWQRAIVQEFPREFIAGLIHSDGCRATNNVVVRGTPYSYPRYFFTNVSYDILMLCAWAFDLIGVERKQNRWNSLSVAKKDSVALLDTFIGPKS